jgi:hypothetical protein
VSEISAIANLALRDVPHPAPAPTNLRGGHSTTPETPVDSASIQQNDSAAFAQALGGILIPASASSSAPDRPQAEAPNNPAGGADDSGDSSADAADVTVAKSNLEQMMAQLKKDHEEQLVQQIAVQMAEADRTHAISMLDAVVQSDRAVGDIVEKNGNDLLSDTMQQLKDLHDKLSSASSA